MQWSRLKRNIESLFAASVKGRVGLYSTRYRTMHDHDGRAWITLDGKEVINMVHLWKWLDELDQTVASLADVPHGCAYNMCKCNRKEAKKILQNKSLFTQNELGHALYEYQAMTIESVLASENPIIRAIGMLDRRLGKRRLQNLNISSEHELVKTIYYFRMQAEGIVANQ